MPTERSHAHTLCACIATDGQGLDDVLARRGAPNLDSRCTGTTKRDYLRASDLEKLPEEVVQLYDNGTATADQVLYFGDRLAADGAPAHAASS